MTDGLVVCRLDEIPDGGCRVAEVKGRPVVVFRRGEEVFALLDRCPHKGGPLSRGLMTGLVTAEAPGRYGYAREGEIVRCPWHAWEFDIRTGQSYCDPDRVRAPRYEARPVPGTELVEGPYQAETFPVRIEDTYVVIET